MYQGNAFHRKCQAFMAIWLMQQLVSGSFWHNYFMHQHRAKPPEVLSAPKIMGSIKSSGCSGLDLKQLSCAKLKFTIHVPETNRKHVAFQNCTLSGMGRTEGRTFFIICQISSGNKCGITEFQDQVGHEKTSPSLHFIASIQFKNMLQVSATYWVIGQEMVLRADGTISLIRNLKIKITEAR